MTLASRISKALNAFLHQRAQWQLNNTLFQLFHYQSLRDKIWPCSKRGQGQLRVIIYIDFVELVPQMLHTKFQGNRPSGSGEEDFKDFYNIWAWRPSWSCDLDQISKISPPPPFALRLHVKFNEISPVVSEEKSFENVDGRLRLPTYELPGSLRFRGAKNKIT